GEDTLIINDNATAGMAEFSGVTLTLTSADGVDTISGVEHIQFNNVTIDIDTVNGNALANLGADTACISQTGSTTGNVLSNDYDINDTITLTGIHSDNLNSGGTLGNPLTGGYGALTLNSNGTWGYQADDSTQSLGAGEHVTDTFTYTVNSGSET